MIEQIDQVDQPDQAQTISMALERIRPQEGDILVIRGMDAYQSGHLSHLLRVQWRDLPFKVPVLVLPEGTTVTLETLEQLREEMEAANG